MERGSGISCSSNLSGVGDSGVSGNDDTCLHISIGWGLIWKDNLLDTSENSLGLLAEQAPASVDVRVREK